MNTSGKYTEGTQLEDGLVITWKYGPCKAVYRCASCGREEAATYRRLSSGYYQDEMLLLGWLKDGETWICPDCLDSHTS